VVGARREAATLAEELSQAGYHDPEFAGGVEYVRGIVAFRDAQDADDSERERYLLRAIASLRESERQALIAAYRPEWSYALGVSLHELGKPAEAYPLLREAVDTFPDGKNDAAIRVLDIALDRKQPDDLRAAVGLSEELLNSRTLPRHERDRVYLFKSQIHLALNEYGRAQAALSKVSNTQTGGQGSKVFRARTRMATAAMLRSRRELAALSAVFGNVLRRRAVRHYRRAQQDLRSVAAAAGLDTTFPRQAMYLMGICAREIAELDSGNAVTGKYDTAISHFDRTARDFPNTHEAVAASLRAGELLRLSGRDEEALQAYRRALQTAGNDGDVHNRWITRDDFQRELFQAWNDWMDRQAIASAIELSAIMSPIVPAVRAQKLNALAHEEWARQLAAEIPRRPSSERDKLRLELLRRHRLTGRSYAKLASMERTTTRYSDHLRSSAVEFHKGHDFENALQQLNELINLLPTENLARDLVTRGRVLMDLDRLSQARSDFRRVRNSYPTNQSAFLAAYLLGQCELERGNPKQAEEIWRGLLFSGTLKPAAPGWRMSLFSLGRHLFHAGKILKEQADKEKRRNDASWTQRREQAVRRWEAAINRLDEFLGRYPRNPQTTEARFLVAMALQNIATVAREKLNEAEVENVRNEHRRRMYSLLRRSLTELRTLQTHLLKGEEADQLEKQGRKLLRDCYYEIAHTYYALDEFDKAIVAYTNAANRYSKDAQVLLAYLQMANCNERLGDSDEAVSLVIQAEVILKQLPEESFNPELTSMTKQEWAQWLQWAKKQRLPMR